jgi:hypothetical protein
MPALDQSLDLFWNGGILDVQVVPIHSYSLQFGATACHVSRQLVGNVLTKLQGDLLLDKSFNLAVYFLFDCRSLLEPYTGHWEWNAKAHFD